MCYIFLEPNTMQAMEEYDDDQEKLLSLSLAIGSDQRKRKRIRSRSLRDINFISPSVSTNVNDSCDIHEGNFEGKVFRLLQMREQMLKQDHYKKRSLVSLLPTFQDEHPTGVHLIHLLLVTATAVAQGKAAAALESLSELYAAGMSLTGDSVQRVVAYFTDGLAARLLTRNSPFFDVIMKGPTPEEEFSAFIDLYKVSPFFQFAHFTANQAIIEAFERDQEEEAENSNVRALHVIDFDVLYGFQWPSLIQSLAEKAAAGARISLRITGLGRSADDLQETENRLVSFSKGFRNLSFEFQGLLRPSGNNSTNFDKLIRQIKRRNNDHNSKETVAVNLVFHLNTLHNNAALSETLRLVHDTLGPSAVVLVEQEGTGKSARSSGSFLARFMESLHYFAAMFDSLDDRLPLSSAERLGIEKNHLGREIKAMLNHEDSPSTSDHCCRKYESFESWKETMLSHGFVGVRMSSKSVIQAKLLLKMRTHYCPQVEVGDDNNGRGVGGGGFRIFERDEGRAISLGWQNRCLITASVWSCL